MTERVFLDSNVVLYAFDTHPNEARKHARAQEIFDDPTLQRCVSAQVIGEFYVNAIRKLRPPLSVAAAGDAVAMLMRLDPVPTDAALISRAIQTSTRWQISYWDALIVEAARVAHCPRVLTEDLSHGMSIDGVLIENPFLDPAA